MTILSMPSSPRFQDAEFRLMTKVRDSAGGTGG